MLTTTRITRGFTFFLFLLAFVFTSLAQKKYPSLLWKITGKDLKKPSYLYGTMHVSNKVAFHLSEQFFEAISQADIVSLEVNPETWLANMEKYGMFNEFKFNAANYGGSLNNFYKDAFRCNIPNNKVYATLLAINPDVINGLLYRNVQEQENFQENTYIDLFIYQAAAKSGKPVIGLEDFRQSMVNSKLAAIPPEGPSNANYDYRYKGNLTEKIQDAYRRGDLDALDSLNMLLDNSVNYEKYLIYDRNEIFVRTIDSVLKKQSIFAGMGAAHLPGENGVIELLREKGYTVEPIIPKNSSKADKKRESIDKQKLPVKLSKYYSQDSLFSFSTPGPLTEIVSDLNFNYRLYVDMVNGSHFSLVRLKTLAPLINSNKGIVKQKLDSLFYEFIPGSIVSKEESSTDDYYKIEITSKLKNGDIQKQAIFITDVEVVIFKLGGKDDYALNNDAKTFFKSIVYNRPKDKFLSFSPPTKGFSVNIKGIYEYAKTNGLQTFSNAENLFVYDPQSKNFSGVIHSYYSDYLYLEEDTFELNILANNFLENIEFKDKKEFKLASAMNFPSINFSAYNANGKKIAGKIIINGIHYYLVYTIGGNENELNLDFLTSFKITDFNYVNKLLIADDDEYAFKVKDESSSSAANDITEDVNKEYEKNIKYKPKDVQDTSYVYVSKEKYYFSPSSGDHISIGLEKFNDYDYRSRSEIVKSIKDYVKTECWCHVRLTDSVEQNGVTKLKFVLSDTGTVRVINLMILIKGGAVYQLRSVSDSVLGMKGWAKDFFDTFTLTDSVIGVSFFKPKYDLLFNNLASSDTILRKKAVNSLNQIIYKKELIDEFVYFVGSRKFDSISEYARASLIEYVGNFKDNRIIEPLKKLYNLYSDSVYLQFSILKSLATNKTQASFTAYLELMTKNTPLIGEETYIEDVFFPLYDSLELCAKFYPTIFNLTKYDEYKASVYKLLYELSRLKLVTAKDLLSNKLVVLDEANRELKKHNLLYKSNDNDRNSTAKAEDYYDQLMGKVLSKTFSRAGNETYVTYSLIVYYTRLLGFYYQSDPSVKLFFSKVFKTKDNDLQFESYMTLLENGIEVSDSVISSFCKNIDYRTATYKVLEKSKLLNKFDHRYLSQTQFCEAEALTEINLENANSYRYSSESTKPVTLVIKDSLKVSNKYDKGTVFILKRSDASEGIEKWVLVYVKDNGKAINPDVDVLNLNYITEKSKSDQYYYNLIKNEFYYSSRKRYSPGYNSPFYND